jgi:Holliday junction resolvase RusA-like endonuclease
VENSAPHLATTDLDLARRDTAAPATIRILVHGVPVPKARPRVGATGVVYTPARTRNWERAAMWLASIAMKGRLPLKGPVRLRLTATLPIAPSWPERKKHEALAGERQPTSRPDTDNIVKAALDALNGIVVRDDSQVVEITAVKKYGAEPGVLIEVEAIGGAA